MARRYDSSRRKKAADQTRDDIVHAALELHWEGITALEPLAKQAGCSLPTVRKHFPSKELLYRSCTRTFAESLTMPDLAALGAISDPSQRLSECVSEICRIHEAMIGYAWLCVKEQDDSAVLKEELAAYEGLADAVADLVAPANSSKAPLVRGLLDFLSYRALRLSGGLSPDKTREELIETLETLIPTKGYKA